MTDDTLTSLALCWRIERRDGVAVGLTGHDRDLAVDGLTYRAAPGMTPSAIERSDGLEPDTMDVAGALSSAAIGEADLLAGRWDGARVELFAMDWAENSLGALGSGAAVALGGGTLGEVEISDGSFTAELAGPTAALARPVVEETSAACRAELGDRRCRVAMRGRTRLLRVTAVDAATATLDAGEPVAGAYAGGRLRWLGGPNCGLESAIAGSDGTTVTLAAPPPFAVAAGTLVRVSEGCDQTIATCAGRFGNAANFRGEPYLPGIDLLTRYPG